MTYIVRLLLRWVVLLLAVVLLLSACAASRQPEMPIAVPAVSGEAKTIGWRRVSFEIQWPENAEPSWHIDALLAHRVVAPVLQRNRADIQLWRFHRRAKRDAAGHRFSFIFYSSAATAAHIIAAIKAQPSLQKLLSDEKIVRADYDDPQRNDKPNIADTSDPIWSPIIQKTWPDFIMGASEMWLGLIREIAAERQKQGETDEDTLYRDVQTQLGSIWREEGQHPFLHHLNALFGYEEMLVIDRSGKAMRF